MKQRINLNKSFKKSDKLLAYKNFKIYKKANTTKSYYKTNYFNDWLNFGNKRHKTNYYNNVQKHYKTLRFYEIKHNANNKYTYFFNIRKII